MDRNFGITPKRRSKKKSWKESILPVSKGVAELGSWRGDEGSLRHHFLLSAAVNVWVTMKPSWEWMIMEGIWIFLLNYTHSLVGVADLHTHSQTSMHSAFSPFLFGFCTPPPFYTTPLFFFCYFSRDWI